MAGSKFPTTLIEAVRFFSDEAVCRDFVAAMRWPEGVRCVACGSDRLGFLKSRALYRCKDCRKMFSVRMGTIFEDSHIPLSKWLPAFWLLTAGKKSRSSHQLAKDLGVTQKTAWFMAHRIRLAMETEDFGRPLAGEVEADETYMGGKDANKHADLKGKGGTLKRAPWGPHLGKVAVMGLLERHGEVRAQTLPAAKSRHVQGMVRRNVAPGSTLYTDAFLSYTGLARDYIHEVIDHSEKYVEGRVYTVSDRDEPARKDRVKTGHLT